MRPLRPTESQWIFDYSALENSPSSHDGISLQDELERRKNTLCMIRSLAYRTFLYVCRSGAQTDGGGSLRRTNMVQPQGACLLLLLCSCTDSTAGGLCETSQNLSVCLTLHELSWTDISAAHSRDAVLPGL